MPNNRQWAFIFWVAVLLAWALTRPDIRSGLRDIARTARSPKIVVPLAVMGAWVSALVYLGGRVGVWGSDLTTDTVFWFITAGLVLFVSFERASNQRRFFRRKALSTLQLTVAVEVFSELFVLTLLAEIVLQPLIALLAGVSVVAAQRQEHRPVKRFADVLVAIVSLATLVYVAVSLVHNWRAIDKVGLLREFALPVWLTFGLLPYVYVIGLFAAYGLAFMRIDWRSEASWWARLRSKLVLLTSFHVKAAEVGAFSGPWQLRLAKATSFRDGRRVIGEFREAQREAARAEAAEQARLVRYAWVDGADDEGRRLDRREFNETVGALRWLATCQMGWHNQWGRYRADLLELLSDDFTREGLPQPSGITLRVAANGDAWYAWRRTVSGWVFAIGAAGPPPDQWEYDGPEPPTGFPGEDQAWGSRPFGHEVNRNW